MRKLQTLLILAVTLLTTQAHSTDEIIHVPEFVIEVSVSSEASTKLRESGESIKGSIFFDGTGTPLPGIKTAPFREVFLGKYDFELEKEGSVIIKNATISKEAYSRLKDKNYYYLINIYSGRRVFKNNILSGGYADGRLEDLQSGKKIEITCGLL
jgi:hypothetical protein